MASSALEFLVHSAQAILDGDPKRADSFLEQVWHLAANENDERRSIYVKYFAEALVRRAYGIHPADTSSNLDLAYPFFTRNFSWNNCFDRSLKYAINYAVMGKERLHLIDFNIPHLYGWRYLFWELYNRSDVSLRVSVILPPFLEKIVNVEEEKQYLIEQAKECGVKFEGLEVAYANSLGEVDKSMNFRRTEDEAVVVFYLLKLYKLVADEGAIERELIKLRHIIKPEIVIIKEFDFDANYRDSNFVKRVEDSFQHYFPIFSYLGTYPAIDHYLKVTINNIVGCEGKDRIVRYQTFGQWRSLLLTAGFLPFPLTCCWQEDRIHEDKGCLVLTEGNSPVIFLSAWKHTECEDYSNNSVQGINPSPLIEDVVQPLQILPEGFSLNQLAAFAEIYDKLAEVCSEYKLPLALTWACGTSMNETMSDPCEKHTLLIQSTSCYVGARVRDDILYWFYGDFVKSRKIRHMVREGQAIARKALQSIFHFEPNYPFDDIDDDDDDDDDDDYHYCSFSEGHACMAVCLQNHYNIDDLYVVEFFLPASKTELENAKSLALRIFDDLKNMRKKFVKVRVLDTEIGIQQETISNIPEMTVPIRKPTPASSTNEFPQYSNTGDGHVAEIQGLLEQGSQEQISFEPLVNNKNKMVKTGENNLSTSRPKKRKLTSNVWKEFTKKEDGDEKIRATCVHCNKKFDGSSKKGTTHLRNHLLRCKNRAAKVRDQQVIFPVIDSEKGSASEGISSFDQDRSSMDVARLIIKHQYLLNIVEDEFFNSFVKNLQPLFQLKSKASLLPYIFRVYKEEKDRLLEDFDKLSCRFNLTITLWTHDHEKTTYCCYAVQFIDDNWELKKKILALKCLGNQVDKRIFYQSFRSFLVDWNFDQKLCSLTVHNSSSCFDIAEEIRNRWHDFKAAHPSSTFYISCDEFIHGLLGKGENGEKSIGSAIRTSNACLLDIHDIYRKKLCQQEIKDYPLMNVKSDNDWSTCSLVLAIAVVLDPRFKFEFVEFLYKSIYDKEATIHLNVIDDVFKDIFKEYASNMGSEMSFFHDNTEENIVDAFHKWYNSKRNVNSCNSELDKYLKGPIISFKAESDILGWWCEQVSSFPILGKMARDLLAIPMSSILSDFAFHEKAMIDNPIFSGLDLDIIEAMICSKDWLESSKEISNVESLNKRSRHLGCPSVTWEDNPTLANYSATERFSSEYDDGATRNEHLRRESTKWTEKEVDLKKPENYYIEDTASVVNLFFDLLKDRYKRFPKKYMKHHSFDSFYVTILINKSKTESDVLDWVKRQDLSGMSKLFLPMCLHKHWILFCADFDDKKLLWLDSNEDSRMSNYSEKQIIGRWFLKFLLPWMGHNPKEWSFNVPKDIPSQKNSVDCAVFAMKYADCLTHGINYFPFTQDDMPHFRLRTFLDLCGGSV
ncbi:hypothetical protein DITRI_Ditri15bG0027900 [Diplodiscus trichospermus]